MRIRGDEQADSGWGDGVDGQAGEELEAEFVAFVHRRARHHLRAAVLLTGNWHTAEDLPVREVAELLGCSPGAVKTHTHRGIRKLRRLLGAEAVAEISQEEHAASRP